MKQDDSSEIRSSKTNTFSSNQGAGYKQVFQHLWINKIKQSDWIVASNTKPGLTSSKPVSEKVVFGFNPHTGLLGAQWQTVYSERGSHNKTYFAWAGALTLRLGVC